MNIKKAISPVVAVALLLVVSVVAVVSFQNWFGSYSSSIFSSAEIQTSQSSEELIISDLVGDTLYVNAGNSTHIEKILIGGNECEIYSNYSDIKGISLGDCFINMKSGPVEITIISDEGVISKEFYIDNKDVEEYSTNLIFSSSCSHSGTNGFSGGDGSEANPYQICDCTQLQNISQDLNANYELISDIDCSDTKNWNNGLGFDPIGYLNLDSGEGDFFNGNFNGNNYNIYKLYINRESEDFVGLISAINYTEISNIGLISSNINGNMCVGGLISYSINSNIHNCYFTGKISVLSNSAYIGGGIVGLMMASNISNSYFDGTISGNEVSSESGLFFFGIGGLGGFSMGGFVDNSYSTGIVSGDTGIGGLIGYGLLMDISNSYFDGIVSGNNKVGGLTGIFDGKISNSHFDGSVSGNDNVGGLIGYGDSGSDRGFGEILNSYSIGTIAGNDEVGGLIGHSSIGYARIGKINNSYFEGSVSGNNKVGGLVGYSNGADISNSYSTGEVLGNISIGGLIGMVEQYYSNYEIHNSYSNCDVDGVNYIGGFAGYMNGSIVYDSFSTGIVTGSINSGQFIGYVKNGTLTNDYFNNVSSLNKVGLDTGSFSDNIIAVDNSIGYFYDNANEPLASWDSSYWNFLSNKLPELAWQ